MDVRLDYPATQRNREPIAAALSDKLPASGLFLEIASGSGQHVVYLAERFPGLTYQPSDPDERACTSIAAWIAHSGHPHIRPPLAIDAATGQFPLDADSVDVVFNANMVHIAPWSACVGLMRGAGRCLKPHGQLIMYGPYRLAGQHTAPSNEAFDADLKARNPEWGVRDLADVQQVAAAEGLNFVQQVPMPANNLLVFYSKT